jgi:hypothetical protein
VAKLIEVVGLVTLKKDVFDVPPPGPGLFTVTAAVAWADKSEAGTTAVS